MNVRITQCLQDRILSFAVEQFELETTMTDLCLPLCARNDHKWQRHTLFKNIIL